MDENQNVKTAADIESAKVLHIRIEDKYKAQSLCKDIRGYEYEGRPEHGAPKSL